MKRAILLAALFLCACGEEMDDQPRYDVYETAELFADGKVMQAPPAGTVARDSSPGTDAARERPPMTLALLERGRERYGIFCSPCHGLAGYGHGTVPRRGFPQPPSFHSDRLREATSRRIFDVVTNGYGVMYSYASRVPPADRWAIVAYIRALQLSQDASVAALPEEARNRLEKPDAR